VGVNAELFDESHVHEQWYSAAIADVKSSWHSLSALFRLGHTMPYMIPYYQSGLLVKFRCTDCDRTYCIPNPCSATVPHDEEKKAKEQYG